MRWPFALLLGLLLLGARSVPAQVAVSRLVPAAPSLGDPLESIPTASFVPENPAAMQWGPPTRWGAGSFSAERTQTLPLPEDPAIPAQPVEYGGQYVGGRNVEEDFSYAGEFLQFADETNRFLVADWDVLSAGVAFKSGETITFGASLERAGTTNRGNSLNFNSTTLGFSVKLSKNIYGGAALGTEKISSSACFCSDENRSVQKFGLAFFTGRTVKWHLEGYQIVKDAAPNSRDEFSSVITDGVVAEILMGPVLIGLSGTSTEKEEAQKTVRTAALDLGWVPKRGWSLILHAEAAVSEDLGSDPIEKFETTATSVTIAFLF
ncbi:MAG: hypothetical protein IIA14_04635 [SAR324 cluster bacterium]|nr:hypothetical protein [SAR324 cluster bacterium]